MAKNVFYTFPVYISFVRNDEALLKRHFKVKSFYFKQNPVKLPFYFVKLFLSLLFNIRKTDIYVSFFAGYSSYLPAIFAKLTKRPHLIILGGTDCVSFPEMNYGNFRKPFLGYCTRFSIKFATHLAPVDASLRECEYKYLTDQQRRQGYLEYCNNPTTPFTVINIGYDQNRFYCKEEKLANSFLTVGQMNKANFLRKGIDLIIFLANRNPHCNFTIVGDSPGMDYGIVPENVKLLPFVPYEKLREIYATHRFYLQLSIMEGFPSAPCEAMLCECVPIVSSVGALPEIVGETGFILKVKDKDKLETIIQSALNSDLDFLGKAARNRIISKFPLQTRNKLIEVIEQL